MGQRNPAPVESSVVFTSHDFVGVEKQSKIGGAGFRNYPP